MKFILLLRPLNLLIIALTMYMTKMYIVEAVLTGSFLFENIGEIYEIPANYELNFFILVLMMVFLAAGGNIINDYFDVRADRINKPNRTYIDYHVNRKTAIVSHFIFNGLAMILSIYLWFAAENYRFFLFALLIAALLWIYSAFLKRRFLVGNLSIAMLTGIVPYITYLYFLPILNQFEFTSLDFTLKDHTFKLIPMTDTIVFVGIFSVLAFLINFVREIIKDIMDIRGDRRVNSKTMPIVIGVSATKIITSLLILLIITVFSFPIAMWPQIVGIPVVFIPFLVMIVLLVTTLVLLILARETSKYKYASITLKIAMLYGLFLPMIINSGVNEL
ncbi:MAG: UbiA family prenyltransferase [Crocinitomicaceae bacterium]